MKGEILNNNNKQIGLGIIGSNLKELEKLLPSKDVHVDKNDEFKELFSVAKVNSLHCNLRDLKERLRIENKYGWQGKFVDLTSYLRMINWIQFNKCLAEFDQEVSRELASLSTDTGAIFEEIAGSLSGRISSEDNLKTLMIDRENTKETKMDDFNQYPHSTGNILMELIANAALYMKRHCDRIERSNWDSQMAHWEHFEAQYYALIGSQCHAMMGSLSQWDHEYFNFLRELRFKIEVAPYTEWENLELICSNLSEPDSSAQQLYAYFMDHLDARATFKAGILDDFGIFKSQSNLLSRESQVSSARNTVPLELVSEMLGEAKLTSFGEHEIGSMKLALYRISLSSDSNLVRQFPYKLVHDILELTLINEEKCSKKSLLERRRIEQIFNSSEQYANIQNFLKFFSSLQAKICQIKVNLMISKLYDKLDPAQIGHLEQFRQIIAQETLINSTGLSYRLESVLQRPFERAVAKYLRQLSPGSKQSKGTEFMINMNNQLDFICARSHDFLAPMTEEVVRFWLGQPFQSPMSNFIPRNPLITNILNYAQLCRRYKNRSFDSDRIQVHYSKLFQSGE